MAVLGGARAARWGGAVLVALAPLPWLGIASAATTGQGATGPWLAVNASGPGCEFSIAGSEFKPGVTGTVSIRGRGSSSGSYGPLSFGPTDANGSAATVDVNTGGLSVPSGSYRAVLRSADGARVASTNTFAVRCTHPTSTRSSDTPTPTDTETTDSGSPSPTNTRSSHTPTPTNTETSDTPTPTDTETSDSGTPSPSETETTPSGTPSQSSSPIESESSQAGTRSPTATVKATRLTQEPTLPHTGPGIPVGVALAASVLLIVLGALLIVGPGRFVPDRYLRKH